MHEGRFYGAVAALIVLLSCLWAAPALAQGATPPPPVRDVVDENGVDVSRGAFIASRTDVPIGPAWPHGLAYTQVNSGSGWFNAANSLIYNVGSTYTVSAGGQSDSFTHSGPQGGGTFTPTEANGSSLVWAGTFLTYTNRNGIVATFMWNTDGRTFWDATIARATFIDYPDGTRVHFHHKIVEYCQGGLEGDPPEVPLTCPGGYYYVLRLQSITNNHGYQLKFNYASNSAIDDLNPAASYNSWRRVTSIRAINNAVDYCAPAADTCSGFTQTWPTLTFSALSMIDAAGQTTTYSYGANGITGIRLPGSASDDVTVAYGANGVSSVTRAGVAHTYAVTTSGTERTTVVTNPNSGTRTYVTDTATFRLQRFRDELNRLFTYGYDGSGRLQTVTSPEGNYTQYTYDGRGNVTQTQTVPKGGSGAQIVTSASYPVSCASALTCNLPVSTTDARGQATEYTYDATHGGVLTVTAPAPTSGADRPQTRYSYTAHQAYYKDATGAVVATGMNVYLPTAVSTCSSGASPGCVGTSNESRTTTAWGPQSAGTANNLLPVSSTQRDGTGALAATSTATYDLIGNLLTVDGPLAGIGDTTTARYDAGRRVVGTISPDPDGGGAMLRRAQRINYAATGLVSSVDVGTVNGTSDPDWAAFNRLQTVTMTYDANRRPVRRVLSGSTTDHAVEDLSYDTLGRPWCIATRMNHDAWATLTSACTLQTTGSNGPDRIVRTSYDAASRVLRAEIAVGTAAQATSVANTYTLNGQLETVTDANGNRTTYVYDNLDRLSLTQMPSPTTDGVSSGTDYEQLTYETTNGGANTSGTVASRRVRDGQSIAYSYDNLGRMTLRNLPNAVLWEFDVAYGYDLLGRMVSAVDTNTHAVRFTYDALGRVLSEGSDSYGTKTFQYDLAGRRTRMTWRDGFYVDYDYYVTGEMTAIRENGATSGVGMLGTYSYDNLGRRTGLTRGNGTTTTYAYDPVSRLATLTNDLASAGSDLTLSFTYNPASQVATRTGPHGAYAWQGHYNVSRSYTPDGLNRYGSIATSGGATITPTYDGRGNLASAGPDTYVYTAENLLATGAGAGFAYDGLGRFYYRGSTAEWQDYAGGALVAEIYYPTNTITRRYVHGPGTDEPLVWYEGSGTSDRRWLHADERGSIIAVSDGSGNAIGYNSYDAYGIPASGNIGRFGYTGQIWLSEIGMWYYKARLYSPTLGRFMQTDPIGYGDGMNLYAYVGNDPVNRTDPTGHEEAIVITGQRCLRGFWMGGLCVYNFDPPVGSGGGSGGGSTGGSGGGNGTPPPRERDRPRDTRTCQNIRQRVQDTKQNLPTYITNTWRWDRRDAIFNDLTTARLNLADASDLDAALDFLSVAGAAAGSRGGRVGALFGGLVGSVPGALAGPALSAIQDNYRGQINALEARLTDLDSQADGTCPAETQ